MFTFLDVTEVGVDSMGAATITIYDEFSAMTFSFYPLILRKPIGNSLSFQSFGNMKGDWTVDAECN